MPNEVTDIDLDVATDLSEETWGNIAALMHRHGGHTPIGVAELFVRASLPDFNEAQPYKPSYDFPRLEDGNRAHTDGLADANRCRTHKLSFASGVAIFQQHGDHFLQIRPKLLLRGALAVRPRESRNVADKKPCVRVAFYNRSECSHA